MIPLACDDHLRERLMMGRREGGQGEFFYSFKLDEVVPADHLVRQIDGVLDLGWVHKELAPFDTEWPNAGQDERRTALSSTSASSSWA
jgi:hypothetical protein